MLVDPSGLIPFTKFVADPIDLGDTQRRGRAATRDALTQPPTADRSYSFPRVPTNGRRESMLTGSPPWHRAVSADFH